MFDAALDFEPCETYVRRSGVITYNGCLSLFYCALLIASQKALVAYLQYLFPWVIGYRDVKGK